jgi:hypothetical protein
VINVDWGNCCSEKEEETMNIQNAELWGVTAAAVYNIVRKIRHCLMLPPTMLFQQ